MGNLPFPHSLPPPPQHPASSPSPRPHPSEPALPQPRDHPASKKLQLHARVQQRRAGSGSSLVLLGASVTWLMGLSPRQPGEGKTVMCPFCRRIRTAKPGLHTVLPEPRAGATLSFEDRDPPTMPPTGPKATVAV